MAIAMSERGNRRVPYEDMVGVLPKSETQLESFHDGYVFRVDYRPDTPDAVLQNDVMTYLEEYRLHVQKSQYTLSYTKDSYGELALRSSDSGEAMVTLGRNAIQDRLKSNKPVAKETADLLGMQKIEEYMREVEEGETILWASPPDPDVGYDYGFFYVGKVKKLADGEKHLKMAAVRLDNSPTLSQFNSAISLLTQERKEFETVNEFISSPQKLTRQISESEIDFVLKGTFDFIKDPKQEQQKAYIFNKLQPYIDVFKSFVKEGASQDILRKMVFALENYTLELKNEVLQEVHAQPIDVFVSFEEDGMSLSHFVDTYAYVPPVAVGSCDIGMVSRAGPNILGFGSIFTPSTPGMFFGGGGGGEQKQTWSYKWGDCRLCEIFTQVGPCKICKTCEKKFN